MDIKGAVNLVGDFVKSLFDNGQKILLSAIIFGVFIAAVVGGSITLPTQLNALVNTFDTNFSGYATTGIAVLATIAAFIVIVVIRKLISKSKKGDAM